MGMAEQLAYWQGHHGEWQGASETAIEMGVDEDAGKFAFFRYLGDSNWKNEPISDALTLCFCRDAAGWTIPGSLEIIIEWDFSVSHADAVMHLPSGDPGYPEEHSEERAIVGAHLFTVVSGETSKAQLSADTMALLLKEHPWIEEMIDAEDLPECDGPDCDDSREED